MKTLVTLCALVLLAWAPASAQTATSEGPVGFDRKPQSEPQPQPARQPDAVHGDANSDCVVNVVDLTFVLGSFGTDHPAADFNDDGQVDQIDVDMVQALWGWTCGRRLIGDVDGSGTVDATDLGRVLGDWGTAKPQSDLNADGTVDDIDLDMLQANWGATLGRRLLGDHTGNDVVDVRDLTHVLANWNSATGQRELDFVLAQWGATSGADLLGDIDGNKHVDAVDQELLLAVWGTAWSQADLDGNGVVDVQDLVILNGRFGTVAGLDLAGDVDGNWRVDQVDQQLVLAVWGTDWAQADLDGDGAVGVQDLVTVNANWHKTFGQQFTGDINGDCEVGTVDEKILLAAWGSDFLQADVDGNGSIDVQDLVTVLGNWGQTCP